MKTTFETVLQQTGTMIVDGSMGSELEALGCNLSDSLWTAKVLAEQPEKVWQVHTNYFKAGADCAISASYQATIPGLTKKGYTVAEAEKIIASSVEILCKAREDWWLAEGKAAGRAYPLATAAVGPYGAYLADGSEYRGNYGVSDAVLHDFHQRRMEVLMAAGADLLAVETQPSLHEALLVAELAEQMKAPYWMTFSCKNGTQINEGDSMRSCAEALKDHPHLAAIGVNCTQPKFVESLVKELAAVTDKPILVYPNSGEIYDAVTKTWHGPKIGRSFGDFAKSWIEAGASAVGGCCQSLPCHIEELYRLRASLRGE